MKTEETENKFKDRKVLLCHVSFKQVPQWDREAEKHLNQYQSSKPHLQVT